MLIAILSDTHLPRGRRVLPARCVELLEGADLILHAGDVARLEPLSEIQSLGPPVMAVHGNVDCDELKRQLPAERVVEADGAKIGLVHDAGRRQGRLGRLRARFPEANAVVFGHTHLPLHEEEAGFQIFNPGSPTERRRAPARTMGLATVATGHVEFELVPLESPRPAPRPGRKTI